MLMSDYTRVLVMLLMLIMTRLKSSYDENLIWTQSIYATRLDMTTLSTLRYYMIHFIVRNLSRVTAGSLRITHKKKNYSPEQVYFLYELLFNTNTA